MAVGDLYDGWFRLAYDFPPSLNTEDDPSRLKPYESPSVYGVDCQKEQRLASGSCPASTARISLTGSGSYTAWSWYYSRLWKVNGSDPKVLDFGAPDYHSAYYRQGSGNLHSDADIVTFMPALNDRLWLATASGSHFIENADLESGKFTIGKFVQELSVTTATRAMTLNGLPIVCNASGVFSYDGTSIKEWTRPIRDSLGVFANKTIQADYSKRLIVGETDQFVIDSETEKLFDFGTSGFRYTTRTLAVDTEYHPFTVDSIAVIIEHGSQAGGTLKWETQFEDSDWMREPDVHLLYRPGELTRVEIPISQANTTAHRFRLRLIGLSSNIYIREIQILVTALAHNSFSQ